MSYIYGGLTLANVGDIVTQASVSTNFQTLIENSAGATSPAAGAVGGPRTGQLWYDTVNSQLNVNTGTPAAPVWEVTGGAVGAGSVPPSPAVVGALWYDTVAGVLKVYDGSAWVPTGATTLEALTDVNTTARVSLQSGIMWDATAVNAGVTGQWVPNQIYDGSPTGGATNDF